MDDHGGSWTEIDTNNALINLLVLAGTCLPRNLALTGSRLGWKTFGTNKLGQALVPSGAAWRFWDLTRQIHSFSLSSMGGTSVSIPSAGTTLGRRNIGGNMA